MTPTPLQSKALAFIATNPRATLTDRILAHVRANPGATAAMIALALGAKVDTVCGTLQKHYLNGRVNRARKTPAHPYRYRVAS